MKAGQGAIALLAVGCDAFNLVVPSQRISTPLRVASPPQLLLSPESIDQGLAVLAATPIEVSDSVASTTMLLAAANALPSAFAAYGHYLALVLTVGCLVTERLTVKPAMTKEEEERMSIADIVYGGAGLLVVVTGYLRVTQYGKGWEFYAHSPIFWLKMVLVAVMGAASFFPTTKIIQRAVALRGVGGASPPEPMSEKLAARMTSIINAELLAIASIPLTAALMARGVGYAEWFPWQAGAGVTALSLGGLGFKYIKEALEWED